MKCEEIRELLSAYQDGETTDAETALVREHISSCAGCQRILKEYSALDEGLRLMPSLEEPKDFNEKLLVRLDSGIHRHRLLSFTKYAAAAGLMITIAASVLIYRAPETPANDSAYMAELPNLHLLDDPDFLGIGYFNEGIGTAMEVDIADNNIF